MGIGHRAKKQLTLFKPNWRHQFSHGGSLRNRRQGRSLRPLSSKEPLHVVFKLNSHKLRHKSLRAHRNFFLVHTIVNRYAKRFFVKVEQLSIQHDHIHLLIRTSRRSLFQYFFRVVAGQIAQRFAKEGLLSVTGTPPLYRKDVSLWKCRPFTRIVRGPKAYQVVRNYIQLNEKEARGEIRYQNHRLKGLSMSDWQQLWR